MTDFELSRAFLEYDIAISTINSGNAMGINILTQLYNFECSKDKVREADKNGVMFQTEFIEETYKDFLYKNKDAKLTLKKLSKWHNDLMNANPESIDWDVVIFSANPNNLQEILDLHSSKMNDEVYWKTIAHCYTMSKLGHSKNDIISHYLNTPRPNRHFLMTEDERKFLDELPDKITIYRGCNKREIKSNKIRYSWTLDRKIAEFFAFEYVNIGISKSLEKVKSDFDVIEKTISKSEVIAYLNGRQESEVLYFPKNS